jgi:hypothetical protein
MNKRSELSNTKRARNSEIMSPPLHNYHRLLRFLRTGLPKVPGDVGCNGKVRLGVRRHFKGMQQTLHLIEIYLAHTHLYFSQQHLTNCFTNVIVLGSPRDLAISLVLRSLCHLKKDISL